MPQVKCKDAYHTVQSFRLIWISACSICPKVWFLLTWAIRRRKLDILQILQLILVVPKCCLWLLDAIFLNALVMLLWRLVVYMRRPLSLWNKWSTCVQISCVEQDIFTKKTFFFQKVKPCFFFWWYSFLYFLFEKSI